MSRNPVAASAPVMLMASISSRVGVAAGVPDDFACALLLRTSKQVGKAAPAVSGWGRWPSPDLRSGVGVELGGGHVRDVGNFAWVGEGLPGKGVSAEDPPPV